MELETFFSISGVWLILKLKWPVQGILTGNSSSSTSQNQHCWSRPNSISNKHIFITKKFFTNIRKKIFRKQTHQQMNVFRIQFVFRNPKQFWLEKNCPSKQICIFTVENNFCGKYFFHVFILKTIILYIHLVVKIFFVGRLFMNLWDNGFMRVAVSNETWLLWALVFGLYI